MKAYVRLAPFNAKFYEFNKPPDNFHNSKVCANLEYCLWSNISLEIPENLIFFFSQRKLENESNTNKTLALAQQF